MGERESKRDRKRNKKERRKGREKEESIIIIFELYLRTTMNMSKLKNYKILKC